MSESVWRRIVTVRAFFAIKQKEKASRGHGYSATQRLICTQIEVDREVHLNTYDWMNYLRSLLCFYTKMCLFSRNNIVFHKVYILYFLYIPKIICKKENFVVIQLITLKRD